VRLHIAASGPPDGTLVFLLHGFPDVWCCWEYQIKFLAQNGFRVITPDQRGYNLSEKPTGIKHYELDQLTSDIVLLADHFNYDTINLAGHDWAPQYVGTLPYGIQRESSSGSNQSKVSIAILYQRMKLLN
jgi:pimeloyl-ACP methyl ester carboxylesterase